MRVVKNERYDSEKERKAERVVELLDKIDESFIEETYKIDTAEKLRAEKKKEAPQRRAKVLRSPDARRWLTAAACFVLTFGILFGGFSLLEKLLDPAEPPKITDNRYPPVSLPSLEDMGKDAITSIDMLNYYSAMKALGEGAESNKASVGRTLLSAGGEYENSDDTLGGVVPLPEVKDETDEDLVYYYELDENEVFTVTKAVYFQIKLTDEDGFLAQKIGTGTVDVVMTENSLEPMITFRNGNRFYSCLWNTIENFEDEKRDEEITNYVFSTHKYIEGFYIVKNLAQENYGFKISFDEAGQAMSFDCTSYKTGGTIPDGAIEILTQTLSRELNIEFTIEQLERYFELGDFSGIIDEILTPSEGLQFELSSDGQSYELAGIGECTDPLVVIPSEYNGLMVTSIKANAFENCNTITSITIPGSIKTIGDRAFKNCASLAVVVIQDGVEGIEAGAFYNCDALTNVAFGNSLKWIKERAFNDCSALREIVLPDSVTVLAYKSFAHCQSLEKIVLSNSLSSVASYTFQNCTSLQSIDIPDGVSSIGDYAFAGCESLCNINFGEQVEYIYEYAFSGCVSLKEVTIPKTVSKIGRGAFSGCTKIESIHIPGTVSNIQYDLFKSCESLTSVSIPSSIEMIMRDAFSDTVNLRTIEYDGTIKQWQKIDKSTGWNTNTADYTVYCTDGIISKSDGEFREGLVFMISEDGKSYYVSGFIEGNNTSTDIVIPEEYNGLPVTAIAESAFYNCPNIKNVVVPDSITEISQGAFAGCNGIESITLPFIGKDYLSEGVFGWVFGGENKNVPKSLKTVILTGEPMISTYAFSGCSSIQNITISNATRIIDTGAFSGCDSLIKIDLPDSVARMGKGVFSGCYSLENITLPSQLTAIPQNTFESCTNLRTISFGNNINKIEYRAFFNNENFEAIYFKGTREEWFAISNYEYWEQGIGEYTVYFEDGSSIVVGAVPGEIITFEMIINNLGVGMTQEELFEIVPKSYWFITNNAANNNIVLELWFGAYKMDQIKVIVFENIITKISINNIDFSKYPIKETLDLIVVGMSLESAEELLGTPYHNKNSETYYWMIIRGQNLVVSVDENGIITKVYYEYE